MKLKLIITFLMFILALGLFAQAPAFFNYQAVIRDNQGQPISDQSVSIKIEILSGGVDGAIVYDEIHKQNTNGYGLVTLLIGNGQDASGSLSDIDWKASSYFIKTSIDTKGGTSYIDMGTTQLVSVPYALHAETVTQKQELSLEEGILTISEGNSVELNFDDADADPLNEIQVLSLESNVLSLSNGGGEVELPNFGSIESTLNLSIVVTDASSHKSQDGQIAIKVAGGKAPYEFYITDCPYGSGCEDDGVWNVTDSSATLSKLFHGSYVVTVVDSEFVNTSQRIWIKHPDPKIQLTYKEKSCFNSPTGSISVVASGGTAPYSYSWTGINGFYSNEQVLNSIGTGSYHITVTDAEGRESETKDFYIEGIELEVELTANGICNGSDGSAEIIVPENAPNQPYTYEWYGYQYENNYEFSSNEQQIESLKEGEYRVIVTDSEGCAQFRSGYFYLDNRFHLDMNHQTLQPCAGAENGSINITIFSLGNYSYEWSDSYDFHNIISTEEDLMNVGQGQYYLRVLNEDGCYSRVREFWIDEQRIDVEALEVHPCAGVSNGSINISQRTPGQYNYEWSDTEEFSSIISTEIDLMDVGSGEYFLRISDESNCNTTIHHYWLGEERFDLNIESTVVPSCSGKANGSIEISLLDGESYKFEWSNNEEFEEILSTSEKVDSLLNGNYFFRATNGQGCQSRIYYYYIDDSYIPLDVDDNSITNTCTGTSNGAIDITLTNDEGYTYQWSDDYEFNNIISTEQDISDLNSGYYYFRLVDDRQCNSSYSYYYIDEISLNIDFSTNLTPTCSGLSNGAIDLTILSEGEYTVEWSNDYYFDNIISSDEDLTNLSGGNYYFRASQNSGCTSETYHVEVNYDELNVYKILNEATITSVCTGKDGSINLQLSNPEDYTYEWSNKSDFSNILSTNSSIENLDPDYYYLRMTNTNGCQNYAGTSIGYSSYQSDLKVVGTQVCSGESNGSLEVDIANTELYTYKWSPLSDFSYVLSTDKILDNLDSNDRYYLEVLNQDGCKIYQGGSFGVETANFYFDHYILNASSSITEDGSILISIRDQNSYTYEWATDSELTNIISTDEDLTNVIAGTYYLRSTNEQGCEFINDFTISF